MRRVVWWIAVPGQGQGLAAATVSREASASAAFPRRQVDVACLPRLCTGALTSTDDEDSRAGRQIIVPLPLHSFLPRPPHAWVERDAHSHPLAPCPDAGVIYDHDGAMVGVLLVGHITTTARLPRPTGQRHEPDLAISIGMR